MAGNPEINKYALDRVLEVTTFDPNDFLKKYDEWTKAGADRKGSRVLKELLRDNGYKDKGIFDDQELHEIAAVIRRYVGEKDKAVAQNREAQAQIPNSPIPSSTAKSTETKEREVSYPPFEDALKQSLRNAEKFPFPVKYTDTDGKSYEIEVNVNKNTIQIGGKSIALSSPGVLVEDIRMDKESLIAKGRVNFVIKFSGEKAIPKEEFIQSFLPQILDLKNGTTKVSFRGREVTAEVKGEYAGKLVDTPTESIDPKDLERAQKIYGEILKNLKLPATPTDMLADFDYIKSIPDPQTKQTAVDWVMHSIAKDFSLQLVSINGQNAISVIAKNSPDAGKATDFEKVLQNVLEKGWISRENLETSLIMMSGDKWSRYVATLADTSQATTKGYVEYLTDNYPDIDLAKPEQARKAVQKNAQIPPGEKSVILAYLDNQLQTVNLPQTASRYADVLKDQKVLANNPEFQALYSKITGEKAPTESEIQDASEAAARGAHETGDGKPLTWMAGIALLVGALGLKSGEGFSLWTSLKRLFVGGLALGGVMLGCSAAREWKKELGMDPCEEAKKKFKEAIGSIGNEDETPADPSNNVQPTDPNTQNQQPAAAPATSIDVSKLTPSQQKGVKNIMANQSLIEDITNFPKQTGKEKQNATPDDYIQVILALQTIPLNQIIYTPEHEQSIFSNDKKNLFPVDTKPEISRYLLKKVLRTYIGEGNTPLSTPAGSAKEGQETANNFIKNYPAETWKDKTLGDLMSTKYTSQ